MPHNGAVKRAVRRCRAATRGTHARTTRAPRNGARMVRARRAVRRAETANRAFDRIAVQHLEKNAAQQ
eukprot:1996306-Lingulodinium_polyedra.AAC.1